MWCSIPELNSEIPELHTLFFDTHAVNMICIYRKNAVIKESNHRIFFICGKYGYSSKE
jgi:hypothetical protein